MPRVAEGRYVIARIGNVVRVNFSRDPEPPAPRFPGAAALRGSGEEEAHELACVAAASRVSAGCAARLN
ncbi:hypothetical protein D3C83_52230 [compost metagenome]